MAEPRRLTDSEVMHLRWEREQAIRQFEWRDQLPKDHPATITNLAKKYGLATSTVCYILARRTYADV